MTRLAWSELNVYIWKITEYTNISTNMIEQEESIIGDLDEKYKISNSV